ncbi:MAG: hypothetical protein ACTSW4_00165 [Candidatus Ranarchaeia archaeon]
MRILLAGGLVVIIDVYADKLRGFDRRKKVDRIILLWLYVNPYGTYTRTLKSVYSQIHRALLIEEAKEMEHSTQHEIYKRVYNVLDSLERDRLIDLFYLEGKLVKVRLTNNAIQRIEAGLSPSDLRRLRHLGETR